MRLLFFLLSIASILLITDAYQVIPLEKKVVDKNEKILTNIISSMVQKKLNGSDFVEANGIIDLVDFQDLQHYGLVSVGTPSQEFQIMFDTGSDLFWIAGPNYLDGCGRYGYRKQFDPRKSKTYKDLSKKTEIKYMKGRNKLDLIEETVTLGDTPIKGQVLGLVTSGECEKRKFDGLMGMSYPARGIPPVFSSMINQKLITEPVFSFYFNRHGWHGKGGELTVGGINKAYIGSNKINYIPLHPLSREYPYWIVPVDGVTVGNKTHDNQRAILDTGTSLILGTVNAVLEIADQYEAQLEGGLLVVETRRLDDLPPVIFTIGGMNYTYTAQDLEVESNSGWSLLGIGIGDTGLDAWRLGVVFLSKVYSIHDYSGRRVALVPLKKGHYFSSSTQKHRPSSGLCYDEGRVYAHPLDIKNGTSVMYAPSSGMLLSAVFIISCLSLSYW